MKAPAKQAVKTATPKGVAAPKAKSPTDIVSVKNISRKQINTSVECIQPGEEGKATNDELRRWNKWLEEV